MRLSHNFGPKKLYGIELSSPARLDELDMAINSWEIELNLLSLEISDSRASIGFLNGFLTFFWG
jgi:hypothetical protein